MTPGPYSGLTGPIPRDPTTGAIQVSGYGVELGVAQLTASYTAPSVAQVDVPGLSLSIIEGSRPYYLEATTYALAGSVSAQIIYMLITDSANTLLGTAGVYVPANGSGAACICRCRVTPTAPGTAKTYKVRLLGGGTSIPTLSAATTGPAIFSAIEA